MNKTDFINKLTEKTDITNEDAAIINDIIEDSSLIGIKNKEEIVSQIIEKL